MSHGLGDLEIVNTGIDKLQFEINIDNHWFRKMTPSKERKLN